MNYIVYYKTTSPKIFDTYEEVELELNKRSDVEYVFDELGNDKSFEFSLTSRYNNVKCIWDSHLKDIKLPVNGLIVGQKHSQNKLDMAKLFIQFPHACQAIVLASTFGNAKYHETDDPETWDNFKKVPNGYNQFKSAEKRHEFLIQEEEESGLHPEFHILWNSLARYERWAMQNGVKESELAEKHIKNWYEKYGVNKG